MYRDPSEFRERFKAYKDGKSVREIYGLPGYAEGTVGADPELDMIKKYEGWRDKTYLDSKGIPTIGWGFTDSSLVSKGTMSRKEGDAYLSKRVLKRKAYLRNKLGPDIWDRLDTTTKAALLSYDHNYPAGFGDNTRFMKHWRAGRYNEAVSEMDAGMNDKSSPGLRPRRLDELAAVRKDSFLFPMAKSQRPVDTLILKSDATRVSPIPTVELKAIDYSDRRNAVAAEAERAMWAHNVMEDMKGAYQVPIWESPSLPALTPVEYDVNPLKTYAGGKVSNEPVITQGRAGSRLDKLDSKNGKLPGYSNGKIRIKPANRGKFNATKKRTGKTTEELTHSKNPLTRKRAIFAQNARKWHHADGKLPSYEDGRPRITTSGAGVTSVYLPAPNSPEVQPTVNLLERIANFLPYVGTIQDWEQVVNGNIGKVPSAVIGTVADVFLPGLRSSYKAAKAYEAASKAAPKLVDKIKYYKASQKAYKKTAANVGYLVAGTYEDILDDLGYQFPLFINK